MTGLLSEMAEQHDRMRKKKRTAMAGVHITTSLSSSFTNTSAKGSTHQSTQKPASHLSTVQTKLQSLSLTGSVSSTFHFAQKSKPSTSSAAFRFEGTAPVKSAQNHNTIAPSSLPVALRSRPTHSTSDTETNSDSDSDSYSGSSSGEDSDSGQEIPASTRNLHVMARPKSAKEAPVLTEEARLEKYQLALLNAGYLEQDTQQISGTPVFAHGVLKSHPDAFTQYGFLAGDTTILDDQYQDQSSRKLDPRLYFNIAAPSSVFICGSQGSGKSHSLSCLLENCLVKSDVNKLEHPLAGLVFHYDTFTSDTKGIPCEAAHLASDEKIKVKILCSPANVETIKV